MSPSNSWAEFAAIYSRTRPAYLEHEKAKAELKALMPEDAKEACDHASGPSGPRRERSALTSSGGRQAMQHASPSIGAIAAALAKAQAELLNPEKSLNSPPSTP
jgi:hypothetical protein